MIEDTLVGSAQTIDVEELTVDQIHAAYALVEDDELGHAPLTER